MTFENLKLISPIQKALKEEGYTEPTPIQQKAIPIILSGRDLLGCAQTGTGKTAAFALPILQTLQKNQALEKGKRKIKALIVTPTRELAIQISDSFNSYGKYTNITNAVIFGGVSDLPQKNILQKGVDVLIATTGRLLDLINQGVINLSSLEVFVLDEADRMLDMGFIHDIKKILRIIPKQRQSLFFSATMPKEIVKLADTILEHPLKVEVTPPSSTADTIQQSVYFVDKNSKKDLLIHVLKKDKVIESALVFTRTKYGADKVTRLLKQNGITAEAIHGNKSQNNRQNALNNFKNKEIRVLVATDIAARGIDIDELSHVINYEIPNIPETYVHRIGRTGRAGAEGISLSFCDEEEKLFLRDIHKLIAKTIPVVDDHPFTLMNGNNFLSESKPANRLNEKNSFSRREPLKSERDVRKFSSDEQRNSNRSSESRSNDGRSYRTTDRDNRKRDNFASSERPQRKWYSKSK